MTTEHPLRSTLTHPPRWTLVIHGGAGIINRGVLTPEQDAGARAGLSRALAAGAAVLASGGAAVDAVEAAVRVLEDDAHFNSARGAVLTFEGRVELYAAIMDGRDRSAGAVAGVTGARNPVTLARAVTDHSPHVLLTGAGADKFAREQGVEQANEDWFVIPERRAQLSAMKESEDWFDVDMKYGTVGAVACDAAGHVAAATSTGGVTGKRWGRVGDSPLIGAGTWAEDRSVAVSATGSGEDFIRIAAAHEISARVRLLGEMPQLAADQVLTDLGAINGDGGVIFAGHDGCSGWSFNTPSMLRGRLEAGGNMSVAIYHEE